MNFLFIVLIPSMVLAKGRPTDLPATANVANAVKSNPRGRFNIKGLTHLDDPDGESFDIAMRATTAYSQNALYVQDGEAKPIATLTSSVVLVPDASEKDLFFGAILVNTQTGKSKGFLVDKGGRAGPKGSTYKVSQGATNNGNGASPMGLERGDGSFAPPADWACDAVAHPGRATRALAPDIGHHGLRHSHDHHDHESPRMRGSNFRHNENRQLLVPDEYYTDTYPNEYSYEVNLYMEYDDALEVKTGGGALDYINLLVSAASSIYEYEVDLHIQIKTASKTARYDAASGTSQALDIMRGYWGGNEFGGSDPIIKPTINLHHALLGNSLGGGIAYISAVCSTDYGFGISASLDGDFVNLNAPEGLVWDISVFAHELGHNFGAAHTHSWPGGDVDRCGDSQCPSELDGNSIGKATIMSYCHHCPGGDKNIGPTFGGHRDVSSPHSWLNEDLLGAFNVEPYRVSKTMYDQLTWLCCDLTPEGSVPKFTCMNGEQDEGEDCEGTNLYGATCNSIGLAGGTLSCDTCSYDTSQCDGCGNGAVDSGAGEECDLNEFNGETCENWGFPDGGTLSCKNDCTIDTSTCMRPTTEETNIEARRRQSVRFEIPVDWDTKNIKFAISGGSGDADLYVKFGSAPSLDSYDCRPWLDGNNEHCCHSDASGAIAKGTYHIMIYAYSTFSGVNLKVSSGAATCSTPNACGGCSALPGNLGDPCGCTGVLQCDGADALQCVGDSTNGCGGCSALPGDPGDPCSDTCGSGEYQCNGEEEVTCVCSATGCGDQDAQCNHRGNCNPSTEHCCSECCDGTGAHFGGSQKKCGFE